MLNHRAAIAAAALTVVTTCFGAVKTWTPNSSGGWSSGSNWGGTAPVNGDAVIFPTGTYSQTTLSNDIAGPLRLASLSGQSPGIRFDSGAPALTLGGNAIEMTVINNQLAVVNNSFNLQTINFDITFPSITGNATRTFQANNGNLRINGNLTTASSSGSIQFEGARTFDAYGTINAGNQTLTLGQSFGGDTTINIRGNVTGTAGLNTGRGTTTLMSATDASGPMQVGGGSNSGTYSAKIVIAHVNAMQNASNGTGPSPITMFRDNTTGGNTGGTFSLLVSANGYNRTQNITLFASTQANVVGEIGGTTGLGANGTATFGGNLVLGKPAGTNTNSRNLRLTAAEGRVTFSGAFSDQAVAGQAAQLSITKTGAGTVVLSGANTYRGTTTVDTGTLLVNNTTGSGTAAGSVTVNNAAILGGTGSIAGAVTLNGTSSIMPGDNNIESLSVGSLTMGATTAALFQVNGWNAGEYDLLSSAGTVNFAGTLDVTFPNGILGGSAKIFNFGGYSGSITPVFHNVPAGGTASFDASSGLLTLVVPEPTTLAILGLSSALLCVRRRQG